MKTVYLDVFSGISGDMFIGALLDLGVDFHEFRRELEKLGLDGYHLHVSRQQRGQIAGTKFDVDLEDEHDHGAEQHHGHTHSHEHSHEHGDEGHAHGHAHGHEHHHDHEECDHHHHGRTFADIRQLIQRSRLSDWVR